MARLPRLVVAGQPHLIIQRGLNGQAVFVDDVDRAAYLGALAAALAQTPVALHAYGLAATEVRLLATPAQAPALAALMQSVGRRYVRVFNHRHQRHGTPWEGRFRSAVIEPGEPLLACLRYVEEAGDEGTGLASAPSGRAWSSAAHHLGNSSDPLVTEHGVFWALGNTPFEREAAYRRYVEQPVPAARSLAIRGAALKGWALGSAQFLAALGAQTGRRPQPMKRGRPRKAASIVMARD